ncbi:uncharacterized protein LOC106090672 [Stomoxys calcitrans]|uniref:uncharacterized protein LOC106090672 n=1 Tax=Stomoxys calcitrans TaxID=35570 RepID=UPI0027E27CB0|nr:uncharacterized protein LOC106090672 [Stomoxys calcitrans]
MVRKRKIPARKHHGVRDPLKQLEEKEKKLKHFVNSPPTKDNDQQITYKLKQFKKLTDDVKCGKKLKRIHIGVEDKPKEDKCKKDNKKDGNKFKSIKQMPGEEDVDYLRRVNRITTASLKEAQYEVKYGVKVIRDTKTGAISIKKKPTNEIDELLKQKRNGKGGGKVSKKTQQKDIKPLDPKLAKELIKQAIYEDEEEKKMEKSKNLLEYQKDVVKFGEIVHAPPALLTLPRKAEKNETVPRPGKKNNLLLKSMFRPEENSKPLPSTKKSTSSSEVTRQAMKGKRKDLPKHTRNMLENERQKLVDLYRNLKKSKGIFADKSSL